jgi:succinyl-diaminopimelate desuccinylase
MASTFSEFLKVYHQEAINQLQKWIQIPSVHHEATITKGKPYGETVYQALQFIGKLAEKDGFQVDYCDGHVTEITFGTGPQIAVYAHADVVPVAEGWRHQPFGGEIDQGRMYGRGTSDDKGPALASYYAIKMLKDKNLIKGFQVKLVIGGNEEKGSGCLKYYFDKLKKPYCVAGFTPDGNFPLIYGEKGISNFEIFGHVHFRGIHAIDAGIVANSVIDKATAVVDHLFSLERALATVGLPYEIKVDGKLAKITIHGKAAHGSLPELGKNAGTALLSFLAKVFPQEPLTTLAKQYEDFEGKNLGINSEAPLLKKTTNNVGLIKYDGHQFSLVANYRFPENVVYADVSKRLEKITPKPLQFRTLGESRLLIFDPNDVMIQTLLKAYQQETGDLLTPMVTIGGGTYAKEAKNTVAFGSKFPNKEDFIHENDEKIDLEDYTQSMTIYARAIYDLGQLHALKK